MPLGGVAQRWFYRPRIEALMTRDARPWFLRMDSGRHEAWTGKREPRELK
jgi:hypothetical protein